MNSRPIPDFLLRLAQRARFRVDVGGFEPAARKRYLPRVMLQVGGAVGQQHVESVITVDQRDQYRCRPKLPRKAVPEAGGHGAGKRPDAQVAGIRPETAQAPEYQLAKLMRPQAMQCNVCHAVQSSSSSMRLPTASDRRVHGPARSRRPDRIRSADRLW